MGIPIADKPGRNARYFTCRQGGLVVTLTLHQKSPESPNSQEMLINTFISDVLSLFGIVSLLVRNSSHKYKPIAKLNLSEAIKAEHKFGTLYALIMSRVNVVRGPDYKERTSLRQAFRGWIS